MACLVIPDIHGRTFWREPVHNYIDQVERMIFLGDYLDPYPKETDVMADKVLDNVTDIIQLKLDYPEKVVLLKGNHDEQYSSEIFERLAGASRCDHQNWGTYHELFNRYSEFFQLAYLESVGSNTFVFSHAGITTYWLHRVNTELWKLADNKVSIADPEIIDRINQLDDSVEGQKLLSIVGRCRSLFGGASTGSILWADVEEHETDPARGYGFQQTFQIFGHTRLDGSKTDMVRGKHFAMIDSQKCFLLENSNSIELSPITQL